MAVTVAGVQIRELHVTRDDAGKLKVSGKYDLMGSNGKVLAKQSFGGYGDMQIQESPTTAKLLDDLVTGYTNDVNAATGLV